MAMVTIVDYKERTNSSEEKFFVLILQGGIEVVVSKATGKPYITARKASIPCTFNEVVVKTLIGTTMSGVIEKIQCDPYDYTLPNGEVIQLDYTYQYSSEPASIEEVVMG
jgi:hypothetical protein